MKIMGEKYAMFVNEKGFMSNNKSKSFFMIGVVFNCDYFTGLKKEKSEVEKVFSEYKNSQKNIKKFVKGLPALIKKLDFHIIIANIKEISDKGKKFYEMAVNDLIKEFSKYLINKKGQAGNILIEDKKSLEGANIIQRFFDIYNKRDESVNKLVNGFMVYDPKDNIYNTGFEISNVINGIFEVIYDYNKSNKSAITYNMDEDIKEKVIEALNKKTIHKIISNCEYADVSRKSGESINFLKNEVYKLQMQIEMKSSKLVKSEMVMNKLINEVEMLKEQLKLHLESQKVNNY